MAVLAWRVWYDSSSYSDADGGPEWAPALGVQAVALADRHVGRVVLSRYDYYWWEHGRWWGGDLFGLWDYLARPGYKRVLFGRTVPNQVHDRVMRQALEDPDLPAKTAWTQGERKP